MKTALQQLIQKFEEIQNNNCKTLQERIFFDGVLAITESFLEKEKHQIIDAFTKGNREEFYDGSEELGITYYDKTFKQE